MSREVSGDYFGHDGYDPRTVRQRYGSWFGFVGAMGDLSGAQQRVLREAGGFLGAVEKADMTRSFKMVVLRALLGRDALPGGLTLDDQPTSGAGGQRGLPDLHGRGRLGPRPEQPRSVGAEPHLEIPALQLQRRLPCRHVPQDDLVAAGP
jgi:hypothetical protein